MALGPNPFRCQDFGTRPHQRGPGSDVESSLDWNGLEAGSLNLIGRVQNLGADVVALQKCQCWLASG